MSREPVVLYGNGKLAELVLALLDDHPSMEAVAVTADERYVDGPTFRGLPLVPFEVLPARFPPSTCGVVVAVGYARMRARRELYDRVRAAGYCLPNIVAPRARTFPDLVLGDGNIIFDLAYVGPGTRIGSNCVLRPQLYVGHDGVVGDHVFITSGVTVGGGTRIGDLSFLGLGATVLSGTCLAAETLVAAGALVTRDTEMYGVYVGQPAREVRRHPDEGIVLAR